jgi:hypothetical protein
MHNDRTRDEILEDIDTITLTLEIYKTLLDESDEFIDDELEDDLVSELAELELELEKFDNRRLN